jgi:hypothetical protein
VRFSDTPPDRFKVQVSVLQRDHETPSKQFSQEIRIGPVKGCLRNFPTIWHGFNKKLVNIISDECDAMKLNISPSEVVVEFHERI